jgi:hypothetical protein
LTPGFHYAWSMLAQMTPFLEQINLFDARELQHMELLMSKFTMGCFGFASASFGVVYLCSRMQYTRNEPSLAAPILNEGPTRHLVKPEMLIATAKMTDVTALGARAQATD